MRDATLEIRTSIVFATVIIVLVFLPIFGLAGVEGRLLTPLAFAYIVALLASLVVAIVVTPALCFAFLPQRARRFSAGTTAGWRARSRRASRAMLPPALDHPRAGRRGCRSRCSSVAALALTRMGTAFLPEFHEGSLTVQANTLPGTSLAKSDEIGRRVEQILLAQPEVVATARRTGPRRIDEHVQGVEAAEIDVGLRETGRPREELLAELRREFSTLPGTNVTIGQPISHRIDHMLSGTRANIAVKVFGDDLGTLRRLGERVRDAMAGVPGVVDLSLEQQMDMPFVRFVLNRPAIARYGLRAGRRGRGDRDELRRRDRRPHLRSRHGVRPGREVRSGVAAPTSSASPICRSTRRPARRCRFALLADVRREQGPNMILRENVQRRIVISCNVAGRDLGSVVDDIQAAVGAGGADAGRAIASSTAASSRASRARRSGCCCSASASSPACSCCWCWRSAAPRDALLVMVNLPLALIGGVAGVFLAGGVLSVASMIGFITLFGIATRNGIMLVSHIQHLMEDEGRHAISARPSSAARASGSCRS